MSLYGMMRTGSSGMNAQASRLSAVADNIANAGTTGYKAASTGNFPRCCCPSVSGNYNSGGVQTDIRYGIGNQGALQYTSSSTDLAINGNGFFAVVQDPSGIPYMTRAGSLFRMPMANWSTRPATSCSAIPIRPADACGQRLCRPASRSLSPPTA